MVTYCLLKITLKYDVWWWHCGTGIHMQRDEMRGRGREREVPYLFATRYCVVKRSEEQNDGREGGKQRIAAKSKLHYTSSPSPNRFLLCLLVESSKSFSQVS